MCFHLSLIKQNCWPKTFLKTLNLMTVVSLYNLSLVEIIWNCIMFLLLPSWLKMLYPIFIHQGHCVSGLVLKNYESGLPYILADLFNMCLKEPCFPGFWKVSSLAPVFQNFGERSSNKNYHPFSLLLLLVKSLKNL